MQMNLHYLTFKSINRKGRKDSCREPQRIPEFYTQRSLRLLCGSPR